MTTGKTIALTRQIFVGKVMSLLLNMLSRGRSQDGGGVGWGEHFLPHKFIKRAFKHRVKSTKQLLNAGRGHQAPRKATNLDSALKSRDITLPLKAYLVKAMVFPVVMYEWGLP